MARMKRKDLAHALESLYRTHNRPEFVRPDPLQCVYRYARPEDQEIAGLIASGLAYGRVAQIVRNADFVFDRMVPGPRAYLERTGEAKLHETFRNFQHRWTTGEELVELLIGIRRAIRRFGSLEDCFIAHRPAAYADAADALPAFIGALRPRSGRNSLMPDPAKGAACKRYHLYLRWMVRSDAVDPGCWKQVAPASLLVPLDTHMFRIACRLGLARRKTADLRAAREVTAAFRRMYPTDPVRYDFVLTRFGIRPELRPDEAHSELCRRARG